MTTKTVVIVGGGYGGVSCLTELNNKNIENLNIVLISKTDFFYHFIASPRTIVDDKIIPEIILPYDNILKGKNKRFIHGKVTKLGLNELKYAPISNNIEQNEEETLVFDYLVLSLGATYNQIFYSGQNSIKEQLNELRDTNSNIKSCARVLIVGGGPVGVETAGEIATDCSHIKVTLITSSEKLVPYMPNSFSAKTLAILRQKNVEVIFQDSVDMSNIENFKLQSLVTKKGKCLEFDAYFLCCGSKPCTGMIKDSFPKWLNNKGQVMVNKNLQVVDNYNIFAIGDCCDTEELKLAFLVMYHAQVVIDNILLIMSKATKLKEYSSPSIQKMLMSVGRDNGVLQVACLTCTGFIPTRLKSKDLVVSKFKSMLGYS
jgi:NADH dehydrogenase FAD-containing subunit